METLQMRTKKSTLVLRVWKNISQKHFAVFSDSSETGSNKRAKRIISRFHSSFFFCSVSVKFIVSIFSLSKIQNCSLLDQWHVNIKYLHNQLSSKSVISFLQTNSPFYLKKKNKIQIYKISNRNLSWKQNISKYNVFSILLDFNFQLKSWLQSTWP